MRQECIDCIDKYGLNEVDCYSCYLADLAVEKYYQKTKKEIKKFFGFIILGVSIISGFSIINFVLEKIYPNFDFGLSFGFWGVCCLLIYYWLPIKRKSKKGW